MIQVLKGVRVLEICHYIAGPFCAQVLGDLGAEVIKIEKAGEGDRSRVLGPYSKTTQESLYFAGHNRNKKSIEIDFRDPEGIEIIKKLVKNSDILVQNYRVGVMEKMGLGYDVLKEINPGLIQVSISGFGRKGPDKDRPAFDEVISYMAGYYKVMPDGTYTVGPGVMTDTTTAMYAAISVLAALYNRSITGLGQEIDLSMLGSTLTLQPLPFMNYSVNQETVLPPVASPHGIFKTKDGAIQINALSDEQFKNLKLAMQDPALDDPKYDHAPGRIEAFDFLRSRIKLWTSDKTSKEIQQRMNELAIPAGIARTLEQIFSDKKLVENGFFKPLHFDGVGDVLIAPFPAKFSSNEYERERSVPKLGEHTAEILAEVAGLSEEEIEKLAWVKKANS